MKKSTIYWIIALVVTNGILFTFAAIQGQEAVRSAELAKQERDRAIAAEQLAKNLNAELERTQLILKSSKEAAVDSVKKAAALKGAE